jgi:hypothetical protein
MMLIIDFLNVFSKGLWSDQIRKKPGLQILIGALLGIIPGCLGAYTAVSLFIHNIIGRGALVATMIATSGDEAFFMFSIIPKTAVIITLVLFIVAIISGLIVNHFSNDKKEAFPIKHFEVHHEVKEKFHFQLSLILNQLKHASILRLSLFISFIIAIILIALNLDHFFEDFGGMNSVQNSHAHFHPQWISITFLVVLSSSLFIVLIVSDHFLKEHLLNHILKKHFLRIFLWTFFTLLAIHFASQYVDLEKLITQNLYIVLILAVLVGIIPESGPHLIFIMLFASGNMPLSILLASSIVQDGHGSLPLLAESQKNFVIVKSINIAVGLIVGTIGILIGF